MHGITESKDEYGGFYIDLARELNRSRVGTLRFDFRGHGESSGSSMDISVLGDVLDIEASVLQMTGRGKENLAFIGTSFGAGPAILASSGLAESVRSLTLIAPVLDYHRTFLEPETPWAKQWFSPQAIKDLPKRGYLLLDGYKLSPRLFQEFRFIRPLDYLQESPSPTVIIHGDRDTMVPYSVSKAAAGRRRNTRLHTLVDTDHGFSHFDDDDGTSPKSQHHKHELIQEAVNFVSSHLS